MREEQFRPKITNEFERQTAGMKLKPSDTQLQRVSEFKYGLTSGGLPVRKNGKAIILDISSQGAQ